MSDAPTFEALIAAGDPVDPDLVSLLAAEGVDGPHDAHRLGRAHWLAFFASRDGFDRDFDGMLANFELRWEDAAQSEALARPHDDFEIGTPASMICDRLGVSTFAEVFSHPREEVQLLMGERSGMLGELTDALERQGLSW